MGDGRVNGQFWIVAEHGKEAGYVRNIMQNPRVRLKVRDGFRTQWRTGTAILLPDDDPAALVDRFRGVLRVTFLGPRIVSTVMMPA